MAAYANNQTVAKYEEPYAAAMRKGYLDSMFNFANQPTPVPVKQISGFDPYEMQARTLAGGLGGFSPYISQGSQMMQGGYGTQQQGRGMYGRGADAANLGINMFGRAANYGDQARSMYAPGAAQQFYDPYEDSVVQQTLADLKEAGIGTGISDRASQIGQGAFGGSRGRIMEGERSRQMARGAAEAVGEIRQKGFQNAQTTAQNAGSGLSQVGSQFGSYGQGLGQLGGQFGNYGSGLNTIGGQFGQFGQGLGSLGGQMGTMGRNFAGLGTTGQGNLLKQIDSLQGLGATGRGIQDDMYGAQFNAATNLAAEPGNRMGVYGKALQTLLPNTGAATTFGNEAGVNPLAGLLQLLGAIK